MQNMIHINRTPGRINAFSLLYLLFSLLLVQLFFP